MKTLKHLIAYIILIILINQCNMREICYSAIGYKEADYCILTLAAYSTASNEVKEKDNYAFSLSLCLEQIKEINECKKESKYWPIPNEIAE
jgi:hypothetical protein